uniref:Uncharacterized protein n=1 Tax=Rhizophora mucronata TaxID=61149 RepID=A0A2P2PVF3_RHIMU
MFQNIEPVSTV